MSLHREARTGKHKPGIEWDGSLQSAKQGALWVLIRFCKIFVSVVHMWCACLPGHNVKSVSRCKPWSETFGGNGTRYSGNNGGYKAQTWSTNRGAGVRVYRSVQGSDIDEIPRQPRDRLCLVHQDKHSEMREEGQANLPQHPRRETIALIVRSMPERAQITWNKLCKIWSSSQDSIYSGTI